MEYNSETEQEDAFNGIVKQYYEKILKFCTYTLGYDRSIAEDCTQDIFLILYENMPKLKDYDKIGGWLYKTAGNICKQYASSIRKERSRFVAFYTEEGEERLGIGFDNIKTEEQQIAEEKSMARAAVEIGKHLKPKDEQMLELAFRQKRPLKEVADRLGISLSAAKSRASRLRQNISALVRELLADCQQPHA